MRRDNRRISRTRIGARSHWSVKRGQELEHWAEGIILLDEWSLFSHPEPRLARVRWIRHIPFLANALRIFHYTFRATGQEF
ncbi:MAG TPA: hypothetical protein PKZ83_08230 [bacterium]|nr:hypothetical protein [bacterium]